MKRIVVGIMALLCAANVALALAPIRVAVIKTDGTAPFNIDVELNDYTGGTASNVYPSTDMGDLTPNSSGVISFLLDDGAWLGVAAGNVNSYYVVDVYVDGQLYAQYRLDELQMLQAQTGSGVAQVGGAGAFKSEGGKATAINLGDDFIVGDTDLEHIIGIESKLFFDASKGAFRVGKVNNSNWDEDSVGTYSFASGLNTKASGLASIAMGHGVKASNNFAVAIGINASASGDASVAMGYNTVASGNNSTAIGYTSKASGPASTAMGKETIASGNNSMASGFRSKATGNESTAMGLNTEASGNFSVAMGKYNISSADQLLVVGNGASNVARANAFEVKDNGNTNVGGNLSVKGTASYSTGTNIGDLANVIRFNSGGASITTADLNANHPNGTVLYIHETSGTGDITDDDGTGISFVFKNIIMVKDGSGDWHIMSFAQ